MVPLCRDRRWILSVFAMSATSLFVLSELHENSEDPGSFLLQRVSSYSRRFLHLFDTLENSTLRHFDLCLSLRVSPYSLEESNLADLVLWVSPDGLMHLEHSRRTCFSLGNHVSRRLRLCHNSSLVPCCILFATVFGQLTELKILRAASWNGWCYTNGDDWSTHHVWNCPLSVCLRVDVWCQQIWFVFLGPGWFCQITNQEQLCGFWIHVSSLDYCP